MLKTVLVEKESIIRMVLSNIITAVEDKNEGGQKLLVAYCGTTGLLKTKHTHDNSNNNNNSNNITKHSEE